MKHRVISRKLVACIVFLVILVLLPIFLKSPYELHLLITIMTTSIAALGFRLVYNIGKTSVAQGSFVAIGAYTSALLVIRLGLSFWLTLPLAGLVAAAIGGIIGYPALKLRGAYFVILTFGLAEAIHLALLNGGNLTGGCMGIPGIPSPNPIVLPGLISIEFTSKVPFYYLALALLVLTIVVMYRLDHSRMGRIFGAIHDNDKLAESVGINLGKYTTLAFTIACFFSGLAGAFLAHYVGVITPLSYGLWQGVYYLIYVIVGGAGNIFGPIIGTAGLTYLGRFLIAFGQYQLIIYGAILIVFMMFLPNGLLSLLGRRPTHFSGIDRIRGYISRSRE